MYFNAHSHSYYSILDGFSSPNELAARAKELGMPGLALTDHGTLSGNREFYKACRENEIKPVLGCEMYISPTDRFDRRSVKAREDNAQLYNHLIVLGKHERGYENLSNLSTAAWREGYYYKPRIDRELLEEHRDGLIVLSGCLNGLISKAIARGDLEGAVETTRWFKDTFEDDFYMEIQAHNPPEINAGLIDLARQFDIKPVVTLDCHFASPEERAAEEMLLILSTKPNVAKDMVFSKSQQMEIWERLNYIYPERPISFEELDLYLMDVVDLSAALSEQGLDAEEMIENSLEILGKIGEYEIHEGINLLPQPKRDAFTVLQEECEAALLLRRNKQPLGPEYDARLAEELAVIKEKKFASYFLVVSDIVSWAKNSGIMVGPGRGSAAGSLVCYLMNITDVDPLKYGLLFGRFINAERNDYPDIDTDYEDERRGEVKDYVRRKFKNVATVSTFTTFNGVGTVKDVARVFRIPISETEAATKTVSTLQEFYSSRDTREFREKYPEVEEYCRMLEGRIRSVGMHAGGVVVSKKPLDQFAPIEYRKDPDSPTNEMIPVVALDKDSVEELGLLKIDTLGLKTLSVIGTALKNIERRHGRRILLNDLTMDDQDVYQMLSNGHTRGVFQAEAGPYTHLLKKMKVDSFSDLAVSTALVRPGAMNTIGEEYIKRKQGISPKVFANEAYRSITEETYGLVVYQEQVMRVCVEIAGMTWAEADKIRKIIGKKKDVAEFDAYRDRFLSGAVEHGGLDLNYAEKLWHDFEAHAGYSFNKSHAVAYSMLTYQTAWLKKHYTVEYMAALLAHEKDKNAITGYLLECRRLGIRVMLPDINRSDYSFSIDGDGIRFGLTNIKYIANAAAKVIIDRRPFESYEEFRVFANKKGSGLSSRIIGAINKVNGAVFHDHPKTDISEHIYEYLGIPVFDSSWMTDETRARLTPASEYEEGGGAIIYGLVTKITTKPGAHWTRIEVLDESGTAAFFAGSNPGMEEGKMYLVLLANKSLMDFVEINDVVESDKLFAKYVRAKKVGLDNGSYLVIDFNSRKTKKKENMATVTVVNSDLELESLIAFPRQYPMAMKYAKPGEIVNLSIGFLDDGSKIINNVRSINAGSN